MKRGTPDHPKMHDLAERLAIPRLYAVGIMEALWHWVAKYAPRGDVGKYKNAFIATSIGWQGDADQLVNALVDAKWLDRDRTYRLIVHDWRDHADNSVKLYLQRHNLKFIGKTAKTVTTKYQHSRDSVETVCTTPLPLPLPEPSLAKPAAALSVHAGNRGNAPKPQNHTQKTRPMLRERDWPGIVQGKSLTVAIASKPIFSSDAEEIRYLETWLTELPMHPDSAKYRARLDELRARASPKKPPGQQIELQVQAQGVSG